AVRSCVRVGVGENDLRALTAQLQGCRAKPLRRRDRDPVPGLRAARERDLVNTWMFDEALPGDRAASGQDVERAGGEPGLGGKLREQQRGERGVLRRLEDHRTAGGE